MGRDQGVFEEIASGLVEGTIVPYLGPGLFPSSAGFPVGPKELADWLSHRVSVPSRLRGNLTAVAQYIENFKHRKTLTRLMQGAFTPETSPTPLHRFLAALPHLPLVVDTWYDGTMAKALFDLDERRRTFCQVTGISHSEHPAEWFRYSGDEESPESAETVLYKPHGSVAPEPTFLVSDADYVEVLTEIDIQTPIPPVVQRLRTERGFLFLGCRFNQQLDRIFARQIMKRSSDRHWAVLDKEPTPKEARFLAEQKIVRIKTGLGTCIEKLTRQLALRPAKEAVTCRSV